MQKIYVVRYQTDMTEGRGMMKPTAYFTNEDDAWACTKGKTGVMGRKPAKGDWRNESYPDWDVKEITVYESLDESTAAHRESLKQAALAKLSKEERWALGL
ncbi:hypothetical protein [Vibrio phage VH7D]|uniref:Uncharacterized protein n=1 Tax=Vibrio phage VH7D TaxID=1262539 RepID=V9LYQ5_9CAUD|nr:hypothetical protein CF80_gp090 [Vibrio phage VH7D]AGB06877.1 hypothetical protein [Vibrio phage VH7D]